VSKNNFLSIRNIRHIIKRIIILNIITYICIGIIMPKNINAEQIKSSYVSGKLSSYPGYENLISNLKNKHPNWKFTILETGLDWNDVIKNETVASHGRNLIYYTNNGNWVCSICGNKSYDSGRWKCASETAVAYYMDPRNWLNENNIFQFENLAYNGDVQNIDGVKKILNGVSWAKGDTIVYTKPDGSEGTLNKSYAQVIMEAARDAGISPYHLAARIKQEQGANEKASSTGSGTYLGYVGYYNFLNIKATGSNIIGNALSHAKTQGWDDPEKSIRGGAVFIASDYIARGQSTLYLQKFDVDNSDGSLYYHQYMQNVSAAYSEGNTVKSSYEGMGLLDANINFVIPVFRNMPNEVSPSPDGYSIVTQNVKVKGNSVAIREGRSVSSGEVGRVNSGDILLRIEISGSKEDGYFWDKVVLANGTKGYIARDFIDKIDDVTNTNLSAVANVNVNLRNGPGTAGTKVIMTLTKGQPLTVIESGKYNGLDGYNWSRIVLNNGTQGYLVSEYLTEVKLSNYITAYINCNADGKVNIRSGVGTGNSIVTSLRKDTKVTVLTKNAGSANGYNWDKIVTSDGLEGYIANIYLRYEEEQENDKPAEENNSNNKFKIDGQSVVTEPNTSVEDIKNKYTNASIKDANGKELGLNDLIGTGCIVNVDGKSYTIVKMGDVNGDATVDIIDLALCKRHLLGTKKLENHYATACKVSKSSEIDILDLALLKRHIIKSKLINI